MDGNPGAAPDTAAPAASNPTPEAPVRAGRPTIHEAFAAFEAKGGTEAPDATPAATAAPAEPPKPSPRDELQARLREGRRLAAEKLAVAAQQKELAASRADLEFAKSVRDAVKAKDYVKFFELTGADFRESVHAYATHDRELTAEERLAKLEEDRAADAVRAKKDSEERTVQERQAKIARATEIVQTLAKTNAQEFKFIEADGLHANVVEYAVLSHEEGRPITLAEAAREFETNYHELRRRQFEKDRSLLTDPPLAATPGTDTAPRPATPSTPTITNRAATSTPSNARLRERDRRQEMLESLKKFDL